MKSMCKESVSTGLVVLNGGVMNGEVDSIPFGRGIVDFNFIDEGDAVNAKGSFIASLNSDTVNFN